MSHNGLSCPIVINCDFTVSTVVEMVLPRKWLAIALFIDIKNIEWPYLVRKIYVSLN